MSDMLIPVHGGSVLVKYIDMGDGSYAERVSLPTIAKESDIIVPLYGGKIFTRYIRQQDGSYARQVVGG